MNGKPDFTVMHAITADLAWTRGTPDACRGDAAAVPEAPRSMVVAARRGTRRDAGQYMW